MTSALDVLHHSIVDEDILPLEEVHGGLHPADACRQPTCMYIANMYEVNM